MFREEKEEWAELPKSVTCSRTSREEGGCREDCFEELGLHPEGGVDLGLRGGRPPPTPMVVGEEGGISWVCWSLSQTPAQESKEVRLEEVRHPSHHLAGEGLASRGEEVGKSTPLPGSTPALK